MNKTKVFGLAALAALAVATIAGSGSAELNTQTTLGIQTGALSFYKDTISGNVSDAIDIGTYAASLDAISAASDSDHRFVVEDLAGQSFTVTLQSSDLTGTDTPIPASNISYEGTEWTGVGKPLTAFATGAADIGTSPVTFVAREDNSGLSRFSQDIAILVAVPAAQTPGNYAGVLTFTY